MEPRPKALLWDVGNVLLRLKAEAFLTALEGACAPLDRAGLLQDLSRAGGSHDAYERGLISGEAFHTQLRQAYGLRWDYPEWLRHWNDYFLPNRPMEILLAKLHGQARFWALSNTNAEHYAHFRLHYRLFDDFEGVIGSHQHGLRKPDPKLYEIALNQMGLPASSVLFIDDLPSNVAAAQALGLRSFHYRFNDLELKDFCRALGFEVPTWENRPSPYAC